MYSLLHVKILLTYIFVLGTIHHLALALGLSLTNPRTCPSCKGEESKTFAHSWSKQTRTAVVCECLWTIRSFGTSNRNLSSSLSLIQNRVSLSSNYLTIGHRLRLNEYILYVFGQTRRPLAVSRAKICPGSRPEVPSTPSI